MANSLSDDTGITKCMSGAVRRLLCTGSLPTHPSEQIPEISSTVELKNPCKVSVGGDKVEVGASPGIVARLMGLESLPESNWVPRAAALNSITRSMSLNFMDYFPEMDRTHGGQHQHRRVRTSVSFREVPTSLHQQNHDCFVLFLEKVDEARKSDMGFGELKQKKKKAERSSKSKDSSKEKAMVKKNESQANKKRDYKRKNEPNRVSGKLSSKVGTCYGVDDDSCSVLPQKKKEIPAIPKVKSRVREASVGSKFTKKKKVDSETSIPPSVTDHIGCPVHHLTPSGGHSRKVGSNRKKSSTSTTTTANWDYPAPNLIRKSKTNDQEQRTTKRREKQQAQKEYCTEMVNKVCRLAEEDMKESHWEAKEESKAEYFEEISIELEHQILNVLLRQVVNELEEFPK